MVPELKLEGVRFRVYRGTDERAFGEAGTVLLRRDSTELAARNLAVVLPRGGTELRISAPAGEGVLSSRLFWASGGVSITRGDDVARTDQARYEPGARGGGLVRGDGPVVVEGRGYRLTGVGFVLDPSSGEMAVNGPAQLLAGTRGVR